MSGGGKPESLGSIAMLIRTAAGWSRARFAAEIGVSEADIKALEYKNVASGRCGKKSSAAS